MANIISYINKYGNKTFEEMPFNEVDNVIFAMLSYINMNDLFKGKMTLEEMANIFFKNNTSKDLKNNITGIRSAIKVFSYIKDEARYKDLIVHDYKCEYGDGDMQYSSFCIDIDKETTYISFEGTDELISGWKEDFEMCYKFPVPSQKVAIKYVNKVIKLFSKRKYILGGHSKGGNLALIASMYMNPLKRNKVIHIYSNDGPGLRDHEFFSKEYKRVEDMYTLIVPDQSIVGLLQFEHSNPLVVKCNKKGLFAHDATTWELSEDKFIPSTLSEMSNNMNDRLYIWMEKYDYKEREDFINTLFDVLKRADIDSLLDIKQAKLKSVFKIIKESSKLDKKTREMITDLIRFIVNI